MVVRRTHKLENVAPALVVARNQFNAIWPGRDKSSDGIWPSAAHTAQNPNSDHEAGNALDIDDDLSTYWDVWAVALTIAKSSDPRVKYMIHDDRIWSPLSGWGNYSGSNPHRTHLHISVFENRRRDTRPWSIGGPVERKHAAIVIADIGDKKHRAAIKALAIKWDNKIVETKTQIMVHASLGKDLDAFIAYANAHGLSAASITVDGPSSSFMKVRSDGVQPATDAEGVVKLAKANAKISKAKAALA